MVIKGRRMGPFVKGFRSRLAAAGLDAGYIEKAVAALSSNGVHKKLKLKRIIIARITEALENSDRIVVVRGKNKIKVYSYDAHKNVSNTAKNTKPWEHKRN